MKDTPRERGPKRIGIWIRVSTADQAAGESPEHHERRARAYAESQEWVVREVYHLEAVSGKSVKDHPETQRMLADIQRGHISGLIFSKLARLARNTKELLEFGDTFREHGADLISLQEAIDTSSPAGRLFFTIIAAMAQWEREEIADRVAASVPIRAKLGKPLGGAAPFGYRWQDRELVPDPNEAPIRKRLYELFLEHRRVGTVARLVNAEGARTRKGAEFTDTTVRRLLEDPTAKGIRRANYTRSLGQKKHWKKKPQSEWVLTPVPGIVTEDVWDRCNAMLAENGNRTKRTKPSAHLFTGVTYCHCGKRMYVPSNSPKYVCYACRNKIGVDDLQAVFEEQLKGFTVSQEDLANALEHVDLTIKERAERVTSLEAERTKVKREMDRAYRAYIDEKISMDGFGGIYRPLEERLKQLDEQIPALMGEIDFLKIQRLSGEQAASETMDLYSRLPTLGFDEKRAIIEAITERIVVGKAEVTINLSYLPDSLKSVADSQRNLRGSSLPRG